MSKRTARAALATRAERNIVEPDVKAPAGPRCPRLHWVASEVIDIATKRGPALTWRSKVPWT
jgi:hypothetical protein